MGTDVGRENVAHGGSKWRKELGGILGLVGILEPGHQDQNILHTKHVIPWPVHLARGSCSLLSSLPPHPGSSRPRSGSDRVRRAATVPAPGPRATTSASLQLPAHGSLCRSGFLPVSLNLMPVWARQTQFSAPCLLVGLCCVIPSPSLCTHLAGGCPLQVHQSRCSCQPCF